MHFTSFSFKLGLVGILIIALITDHCCQLIIKCKKAAVQKVLDTVSLSEDVESQETQMLLLRSTVEKRMVYGDIGRIAIGKSGVLLVNVALLATQYGFCIGYFIFMGNTISSMFSSSFGGHHGKATTTPSRMHNSSSVSDMSSAINVSIWDSQKSSLVYHPPPFAVLILMPLIPLILFSYIRGVRRLGPISVIANVSLFVAFLSVIGYMLSGKCISKIWVFLKYVILPFSACGTASLGPVPFRGFYSTLKTLLRHFVNRNPKLGIFNTAYGVGRHFCFFFVTRRILVS